MPGWRLFTSDDLKNALSQPEMDFFSQAWLEPDQIERVNDIVSWVTGLVRGKVAAWPPNRNRTDPNTATIPAECLAPAIEIARYKLLTSFPTGQAFIDAPRTQSYKDSLKFLDDVATGKMAVSSAASEEFDQDPMTFGWQPDSSNLNWPPGIPNPGNQFPCMPFDFSA